MREIGIELRRGNKTASEARESGIELRRGKRTAFGRCANWNYRTRPHLNNSS